MKRMRKMSMFNRNVILNLWYGGVTGLYLGLVLYALFAKLIYSEHYNAHQLINGYSQSMFLGCLIGIAIMILKQIFLTNKKLKTND